MSTKNSTANDMIFFSKQPILDAEKRIWGYELLGGEIKEGAFQVFSKSKSAAASLSSSTYYGLQEAMDRGKRLLVAFDKDDILTGLAHAFPPENGGLRIPFEQAEHPELVEKIRALRNEGYVLTVDIAESQIQQALTAGDILALTLSGNPPSSIPENGPRFLIRGLKTREEFLEAIELGFSLFQGSFFKEPELVPGKKLSSNEISRLTMLQIIEADEPDLKGIAEAVKGDVAISFRLLTLLNSAAFGLAKKIESVDHAVRLLGWNKLKSWLRAVLIADMAGQAEAPRELAALSMQRGKFLELITEEYDYWGFNPETMFLLGMFSLLDTILGMPMNDVVELLPLDAKLKASLRNDEGNEHKPLFDLISSLEDGDWVSLDSMVTRLGFDMDTVKEAYTQAMNWTGLFFYNSPNTPDR
jgi:EAL and modified HD-GYP domain-containing signal transduction protein